MRVPLVLLAFCSAACVAFAAPPSATPPAAGDAATGDSSVDRPWALNPVRRPPLPDVRRPAWARTPVDRFLLARLDAEQLTPSVPADRAALARRLHLALTGLPPTLDELDAFESDVLFGRPDAVERLVDRLLAAPAYGERAALPWLDLARYADTHGYHADTHREMWRWRDWVIEAFNRDLPFDRFSIEQLAGDLLPGASLDQQIATGFQRNHMIIFENGVIGEEYRSEYVADRTVTFGLVWLGLTFQCARCHDHKHDPLTQRDFYRLSAFFNNVPENGVDGQFGNAEPFVSAPTRLQQESLERLRDERDRLDARLADSFARTDPRQAAWERELASRRPKLVRPPDDLTLDLPLEPDLASDVAVNRAAREPADRERPIQGSPSWVEARNGQALLFDGETAIDAGPLGPLDRDAPFTWTCQLFATTGGRLPLAGRTADDNDRRGWELALVDRRLQLRMTRRAGEDELIVETERPLPLRQWQSIVVVYDGGGKAAGVRFELNGKREPVRIVRDALGGSVRVAGSLWIGRNLSGDGFRGMLDDIRLWPRALDADELAVLVGRDPVAELLAVAPADRSADQRRRLRQWYLETQDADYRAAAARRDVVLRELTTLEKTLPTSMVMRELPQPRPTFVLERGEYQSPRERVEPGFPAVFGGSLDRAPPDRLTRLDLARWLFSPDHPLVARVAVNRFWQELFGRGLVATSDDFGRHGEPPSHPELLDWLAAEFRTGPRAWEVKSLERMLVTSAAFQQSNRIDPALLARDPDNRLLARGPRRRLPAESIRDGALAAAELLERRTGGPSVFPDQPPGLWEELAYDTQSFTAQRYVPSTGGDRYRRSLYTFWKRAVPPPALALLDAPDREVCTVSRTTGNSPLQALVLMNEPTYTAAARELVRQVERTAVPVDQRLSLLFRRLLARRPSVAELTTLRETWSDERRHFLQEPAAARALLQLDPQSTLDAEALADRAALVAVASVVLQLDEALVP